MNIIFLIIGFIVGAVFVYLILGFQLNSTSKNLQNQTAELNNIKNLYDEEKLKRVSLETKVQESEKNFQEQKNLLEEERKKITDTFGSLSKEALVSNNKLFLDLAKSTFEKLFQDAKSDLSQKETAIGNLFKPLHESLTKYDLEMKRLEENRQKAYGNLENYLNSLVEANKQLQKETGNLVMALRTPQVRGRWGEITLKRVVELAGLSEHIDFTEQNNIDTEEGRLRPDMVVHLPSNRLIVVDSKVSLHAYMEALNAETEEQRIVLFKKHAHQVLDHLKKLSKKAYWDQFDTTPEFVVMFIPGESFFSVAVDFDKTLIEEGIQNKVILATPTTLVALLKAVSYGWRQELLNQNALEIRELGTTIYERISSFIENFSKVGKNLDHAVEAYNKSVGSLESRVLVTARKLKELGCTNKENLEEIEQIEKTTRVLPI